MAIDFTTNIDSLLTELSKEAKEHPKAGPKVSDVDFSTDIQSLYNNLANESRRVSAEITSALENLDVHVKDDVQDIIEELSVGLKKEEPKEVRSVELKRITEEVEEVTEEPKDATPEEVHDLVSHSAQLLSTLEDVNYKPDADNEYIEDVGRLAKRIEVMQNTLSELTSVGWGQAGMTYGSGEVRLEFLDDVNRDSAKTDGYYLKYQSSTDKWVGSASTETEFDPAGYEYTNDSSLYLLENASELGNGIFCEEGVWTKLTCDGYTTNNLPTGTHSGIAGSADFTGSGSTTYSRLWNKSLMRFHFDELDLKTVVVFRLKVDMVPDTNNSLVQARINFVAIRDGTDNPLLESSLLYPTDPEVKDRILLEDGTGYIAGDFFQAYNFTQAVAAQELADGAGEEQERTFVFPIYVGDASAQRGFGEFEILGTADMVVNDTSILGYLN